MTTSTAWIANPVATASAASRPSPSGDPRSVRSDEPEGGGRLASSVADTRLTLRGEVRRCPRSRPGLTDRSRPSFRASDFDECHRCDQSFPA